MSDDDFARPDSGARTGGKHRGPRFSWNPAYEETFFRALCESVQLGLREGSTFRAEAWDRAAQALADRHNAYPNKKHLINKSDNARKKFRLWRSLREDPEFSYNPATRMVTGTDDSWRAHIEKEPLSRSLKGRPFEYEHYYEMLFPDVIGSGGAPKRITRPRRKDLASPSDLMEEQGTSNAAMLDLLNDTSAAFDSTSSPVQPQPQPQAQPQQLQRPPPTAAPATTSAPVASSTSPPTIARPPSTAVPPRTAINSTSALTPPEETAPHTRKRLLPPDGGYEKRRRTDPVQVRPPSWAGNPQPMASSPSDGVSMLADAMRSAKARTGWPEQALDIFFRDFIEEDMDLQLKIAEKALTDENKALVFCKMPIALRKHWVKRLREVHNNRIV